jgi:hypothetical protein
VLGEASDITTIGVHHAEVAIGLKQTSGQLGIGINGDGLRIVFVQTFHIAVAAGGERYCNTAANRTGSDGILKNLCNHNSSSFLEFDVDVETIAAA